MIETFREEGNQKPERGTVVEPLTIEGFYGDGTFNSPYKPGHGDIAYLLRELIAKVDYRRPQFYLFSNGITYLVLVNRQHPEKNSVTAAAGKPLTDELLPSLNTVAQEVPISWVHRRLLGARDRVDAVMNALMEWINP